MFQMSLSQSQRPSSCFQCTMYLANAVPFSRSCSSASPISTAVFPAISTSSVVSFAAVTPAGVAGASTHDPEESPGRGLLENLGGVSGKPARRPVLHLRRTLRSAGSAGSDGCLGRKEQVVGGLKDLASWRHWSSTERRISSTLKGSLEGSSTSWRG